MDSLIFLSIFGKFTNKELIPFRRICKDWKRRIDEYLNDYGIDFTRFHIETLEKFFKWKMLKHQWEKNKSTFKLITFDQPESYSYFFYAGKNICAVGPSGNCWISKFNQKNQTMEIVTPFYDNIQNLVVTSGYMFIICLVDPLLKGYIIYCYQEDDMKYVTTIKTAFEVNHIYSLHGLLFFKNKHQISCCQLGYLSCISDLEKDIQSFKSSNSYIYPTHLKGRWIFYSKLVDFTNRPFTLLLTLDPNSNNPRKPFNNENSIFDNMQLDHVIRAPTCTIGLYFREPKLIIVDIFSGKSIIIEDISSFNETPDSFVFEINGDKSIKLDVLHPLEYSIIERDFETGYDHLPLYRALLLNTSEYGIHAVDGVCHLYYQ